MSKGQKLRALVNKRLTAAAEEIFELFERTIAEYEEEVLQLKLNTQQQVRLVFHDTGVQIVSVKSQEEVGPSVKPPHIKEEPEEAQPQEFPLVSVKTEDDESCVFHQRLTGKNGVDCGAEAGCSSDPQTHLQSDTEGHTTDHSKDSTQEEQNPPKRRNATESSVIDVGEDPKPHMCSDCGKRFQCNSLLLRHMSVHTGQKPFKCAVCEKRFNQKIHVKEHMRTHTGEKPYTCSVCERCFAQASALKKHIGTHLNESPDQTLLKKTINTDTPASDVVENPKPHRCSRCGKGFQSKSLLRRHMSVHTGRRPFKCPVCDKRFNQKVHAKEHLRIHTGEKPYTCSVCMKRFTQASSLRKHVRTHSNETPDFQNKEQEPVSVYTRERVCEKADISGHA